MLKSAKVAAWVRFFPAFKAESNTMLQWESRLGVDSMQQTLESSWIIMTVLLPFALIFFVLWGVLYKIQNIQYQILKTENLSYL